MLMAAAVNAQLEDGEILRRFKKISGLKFDVSIRHAGQKCVFLCSRQGQTQRVEVFGKQALRWVQIQTNRLYPALDKVGQKDAASLLKLLK